MAVIGRREPFPIGERSQGDPRDRKLFSRRWNVSKLILVDDSHHVARRRQIGKGCQTGSHKLTGRFVTILTPSKWHCLVRWAY